MKCKIQKLLKSEMEIEIEVPAEELQVFVERTISDFSRNLKVEGFRQGKVPREIIEREIGTDRIFKEAGDKIIKDKYFQAILENKLEPISSPEIEILKLAPGNPLIFKARFSVLPNIQLPDYKKIASLFKAKEIQVSEEEIDKTLLQLQRSRAKFSQVSRPAKIEDFVEIEFSSPQIEMGKTQKDGFLLGQGQLIPGFEEKLERMTAGEEKDFSLKFPDKHFQPLATFQEKGSTQGNIAKGDGGLASKVVNFKVKMESVKKMELPEANDQFAKSLGNFEDLSALKQSIKEGLKSEKEILEKQKIHQDILNKITEAISWEIPEALIGAEKNRIIESLKQQITDRFKISFDEYLQRLNKSEQDLKDSFQSEAETRIKNSLILKEISRVENIGVSEEEVKVEINQFLKNYPDTEKAKKELDLEKLKDYYKEAIKNKKTLAKLESFITE